MLLAQQASEKSTAEATHALLAANAALQEQQNRAQWSNELAIAQAELERTEAEALAVGTRKRSFFSGGLLVLDASELRKLVKQIEVSRARVDELSEKLGIPKPRRR